MRKRPNDAIAMTPDHPQSAVYMLARREWNERYGSYIAQRDGWRMAALAALGVAALAVGGLIYDRNRSYVVPYIVEVDKLGDALAIARADVAAQRRLIEDAYAMIDRHGAAFQTANEWFEANDPFKRAANELVGVQVESVLPISANTWRIEWREEMRGRDGTLLSRQPWQAVATVNVIPPTTDAAMLVNPTGLFVEAFSWTPRQ